MAPLPSGHITLRAGGEEVDAAGNHAPEHLRVDIFKVQVVKAVKMAIQPADGVHARIEEMAGVETQTGYVMGICAASRSISSANSMQPPA
jgi:hypothetical protein